MGPNGITLQATIGLDILILHILIERQRSTRAHKSLGFYHLGANLLEHLPTDLTLYAEIGTQWPRLLLFTTEGLKVRISVD